MPIHVHTKYVQPADSSLPPLAVQVTQLVGSYMIWVGCTEQSEESVHIAPSQGSLVRDWSCAMPSTSATVPAAATVLFRTSNSDISQPMAQRLARRFKKQIFLSVDVPPSFMTLGDGARLSLAVEKAVVDFVKSIESSVEDNRP